MRKAPACLLLFCCLLAIPRFVRAEPHNSGAAIGLSPSGIRVPILIVPQPDSGAFVLSEDTRNGAVEFYAQRTDRHGRPTLGAGGKLVWTNSSIVYPSAVLPDGAGGGLFTWTANRGASGQDVMIQRVLPDGSLGYGPGGIVVCNAAFDQSSPALAAGPAGSYYVVWADDRANVPGVSDYYVQRLSVAGVPQFAPNGILLNTAAYRTLLNNPPAVAPDLLGGVLVEWTVSGGGLRAQRVSSAGALQYTATGVPLGDPSDYTANIAPDGTGGLWAAMSRSSGGSTQPFAQHLTATGTASFVSTGIPFHSPNPNGFSPYPVRNASGGCLFFTSLYSGSSSGSVVFRQEMDAAGNLLRGPDGETLTNNNSLWTVYDAGPSIVLMLFDDENGSGRHQLRIQRYAFDGTAAYPGVGLAVGRDEPTLSTTAMTAGASGNIVMEAHADARYNQPAMPYNYQAFGQAYDASGNPLWDDAENPAISAAADAPHDQGGLVRTAWGASAGDSPAARVVRGYHGWRALGSAPPAAARALAMRPADGVPFTAGGQRYVSYANLFWEQVGTSSASQLDNYALTLPTGQDSTGAGSADESFMIEAWDDSLHHWWSTPLVAHSVDNIAPATPAPFTGQYLGGSNYLAWGGNSEADLAGYRLYRGGTVGFVPEPGNLVASLPDNTFTDAAGGPYVYKLAAVDVHGNVSGFATLTPTGSLGVDDGPPRALAFALASTNPARGQAALRLALPAAAHVRVAIYDAAGREVRRLADDTRAPGTWTFAWDGTDAAGGVAASGLYFARLETAGRTLAARFALTR